eukprot:12332223-Alexandrium_andersonii.AAC.1
MVSACKYIGHPELFAPRSPHRPPDLSERFRAQAGCRALGARAPQSFQEAPPAVPSTPELSRALWSSLGLSGALCCSLELSRGLSTTL